MDFVFFLFFVGKENLPILAGNLRRGTPVYPLPRLQCDGNWRFNFFYPNRNVIAFYNSDETGKVALDMCYRSFKAYIFRIKRHFSSANFHRIVNATFQ